MSLEVDLRSSAGAPLAQRTSGARPLRVLHVGKFYPPHMGGIETHLEALSRELTKIVDLRVVVASDGSRSAEELIDGVRVLRVATPVNLFSAPVCPGIVSQIRRTQADILHIHLPNPIAVLSSLAAGHRGHLVITYHSDTVRQKFLGQLFEPFLQAILRRSSVVIATSSAYLDSSPFLSAHRDKCRVIPYGIDTHQFQKCESDAVDRIRREHGDRLVISVGRLVYYKGFEYLIRAMADVRGKLLIVGDGPLRGQLETLVDRLGIRDKVIFTGEIDNSQTAPYYHAAKVFVLASIARSEAFGIVQIEAMAAGLPVINTRLESGVPFVSLHGQTGLTVEPANPSALASAINRLLDNPDLRNSLGVAGVQRANAEFSLERMATRTVQLYNEVMQGATRIR